MSQAPAPEDVPEYLDNEPDTTGKFSRTVVLRRGNFSLFTPVCSKVQRHVIELFSANYQRHESLLLRSDWLFLRTQNTGVTGRKQ